MQQAYRAAALSNPMDMKGKNVAELELLIEDLSHFQFQEIQSNFWALMKK
jgi:hypothetical protein